MLGRTWLGDRPDPPGVAFPGTVIDAAIDWRRVSPTIARPMSRMGGSVGANLRHWACILCTKFVKGGRRDGSRYQQGFTTSSKTPTSTPLGHCKRIPDSNCDAMSVSGTPLYGRKPYLWVTEGFVRQPDARQERTGTYANISHISTPNAQISVAIEKTFNCKDSNAIHGIGSLSGLSRRYLLRKIQRT